MVRYTHQFKRGWDCSTSQGLEKMVRIGQVPEGCIKDSSVFFIDDGATGALDGEALKVPAPGVSQNFMAPANDTTNRRCQEWTMDFLRHLRAFKYITPEAADLAQAERDPPTHGVSLRAVGRRASAASLAQQAGAGENK